MINYIDAVPYRDYQLAEIVEQHINAMHADIVGQGHSEQWAWSIVFDVCEAIGNQPIAAHRNVPHSRRLEAVPA